MPLESALLALEKAIHGKFEEINLDGEIEQEDVRNALTTFFAEQQARPELVALFKSQSLMYDYLSLSLEEREELDGFRKIHWGYLQGNGEEMKGRGGLNAFVESMNLCQFIRKQRYVNQLLKMFDFYLENREEGEVFNVHCLITNKKLKRRFGKVGMHLKENARNNFEKESGLDKIIELACQTKQEIKKYMTFKETLKIDGVNQIIRMFDFYLENREEGEVFNVNYLFTNKKLKRRFGNLGCNLYLNARRTLKEEGGLDFIINLVADVNPEIKKYMTFKETLKIDGVNQIIRMFDFYLENREGGEVFNGYYLINNQKLKERFGNLGGNLDANARRIFREEGRINYTIQLAAQKRPEILEYWKYNEKKARGRKRRKK